MQELIVDFIVSLDGYASAEGWPGWWGLEGPEYLRWLDDLPERNATLLMGATTYRIMSGFATHAATSDAADAHANERDSLDELLDSVCVVVISSSHRCDGSMNMHRTVVIFFVVGLVIGVSGTALATHIFSDVPDGSTHADGIHWAAERGLVEGFPDGTYRPSQALTRGQLATILFRQGAYRGPQYTLTPECGSTEFVVVDFNNRGSGAASVEFSVDGRDRQALPEIPAEGSLTFDAGASGIVSLFVDGVAWAHAPTAQTCTP